MNTPDPIVTIQHVRAARLCVRGARTWFTHQGLDFRHFLAHGYPASVMEATHDALGIRVADLARAQEKKD